MWSRSVLKQRAKTVLSRSYWGSFLVCLVTGLLGGGVNHLRTGVNSDTVRDFFLQQHYTASFDFHFPYFYAFWGRFATFFLGLATLFSMVGLIYTLFVAHPLQVGKTKYFLESRRGNREFARIFHAFGSGRYMEIVKTMAWRYLWTLLWTLLLIVPGIVKAFAYSMVPYILADNPEIGYRRALQLSQEMTRGHKWNILVLGFSFIGWYLLGAMLLMVGVFFVHPYFEATMAELYGALRKEALEKGLCSPEEFYLDQTDYVLDHQGPIEF